MVGILGSFRKLLCQTQRNGVGHAGGVSFEMLLARGWVAVGSECKAREKSREMRKRERLEEEGENLAFFLYFSQGAGKVCGRQGGKKSSV